eukprot:5637542-Amphidinium_carterae.1
MHIATSAFAGSGAKGAASNVHIAPAMEHAQNARTLAMRRRAMLQEKEQTAHKDRNDKEPTLRTSIQVSSLPTMTHVDSQPESHQLYTAKRSPNKPNNSETLGREPKAWSGQRQVRS